jgi:hypothetical protein
LIPRLLSLGYPAGTGKLSLRSSIAPNRRRFKRASANNSQ